MPSTASWHLSAVDAPQLWATSKGAGITVAVLDSGVKTVAALPVVRVKTFDHAGQPSTDIHGGHGTFCAGLVASSSASCSGVAPEANVASYRVTLGVDQVWPDHVERAIARATASGCDVISCSFVLPHATHKLRDLVADALGKGIVVIVATGNDPNKPSQFPDEFPGVVCVGATQRGGPHGQTPIATQRVTKQTDVFAPGQKVLVPRTTAGAEPWQGRTSGATAVVAGVVATILGAVPANKRRRVGMAMDGLLRATALSIPFAGAAGGRALIVRPAQALAAAIELAKGL